jgi:hypothetical protein
MEPLRTESPLSYEYGGQCERLLVLAYSHSVSGGGRQAAGNGKLVRIFDRFDKRPKTKRMCGSRSNGCAMLVGVCLNGEGLKYEGCFSRGRYATRAG